MVMFARPWLALPAALIPLLLSSHTSGAVATSTSSQLQKCPVSCQSTSDPAQWTLYNSVEILTFCQEPTLFQVSLSSPVENINTIVRVRACTAGDGDAQSVQTLGALHEIPDYGRIARKDLGDRAVSTCPAPVDQASRFQLIRWDTLDESGNSPAQSESLELLHAATSWSATNKGCETSVLFGHLNGTFVGYFGGRRVAHEAALDNLAQLMTSDFEESGTPGKAVLQHCGLSQGQNSTTNALKQGGGVTAGLVVSHHGQFDFVHQTLRRWDEAKCVQGGDGSDFKDLPESKLAIHSLPAENSLDTRQASGECKTTRVEPGDTCISLAERCRITYANYVRYNTGTNHCNTLKEGQHVCCGSGKLPDVRPKPNSDGTCSSYVTKPEDHCAKLAASNGLTLNDISNFNKNTWGWSGCDPLGLGVKLCLSTGKAPMPAAVENAECGPTKPGSGPPRGDQTMKDLNPCPLHVCCNIWGQCGLTDDFCTVQKSKTGAPGTSGHANGCVQNCETGITNNAVKPATFRKLGYFEAWNMDRKCLHMDVEDTLRHEQRYTDIHFAFGEISESLEPFIPKNQIGMWERFVKMQNHPNYLQVRKILAFGGWTFSTDPSTYYRFPNAVKPANRAAFARKVVDFAKANKLDGIDFDWEYPGAPDMPGIPPGGSDEGPNYLAFLQEVRRIMPSGMTLSIAAPASYWYLKAFPIARMAPLLDYIVYMTYDLHGQWDAGNKWASPGCPTGNCLRSHVNNTETEAALAMITKAGVPAHKVLVGVATYGRSFKMTTPGCTGPNCFFRGDKESPAAKGECTETGGYLALAEINKILKENPTAKTWIDRELGSNSNVMVYNQTEWVAYMDDNIRKARELQAFRRNFGGTIEWAVDLQEFRTVTGGPGGPGVEPPLPVGDGPWRDVQCDHPDLEDAFLPGEKQWAAAEASSAWDDAVAGFKYNQTKEGLAKYPQAEHFNFTESISNFWDYEANRKCDKLTDRNGCGAFVECKTAGNAAPAGGIILNSIIGLHNMLFNLHSAVGDAIDSVDKSMTKLTESFDPKPKGQSQIINILLDIVTMGYGSAMGPLWKTIFEKNKWMTDNPGRAGAIEGIVTDLTSKGINQGVEALKKERTHLSPTAELRDLLTTLEETWKSSLTELNNYLLSGRNLDGSVNPEGIAMLGRIIDKGSMVHVDVMDKDAAANRLKRAIYPYIITAAWRLSEESLNPFIVDSGRGCAHAKGDETIQKRLADDTIDDMVCDDKNDRGYFLASAYKPKDNCHDSPFTGSFCKPFRRLPGAKDLDSRDWGEIKKADVVIGSVRTFEKNGKKNMMGRNTTGTEPIDFWRGQVKSWTDHDLRSPGIFDIPVCDVMTAVMNSLDKASKSSFKHEWDFPCTPRD